MAENSKRELLIKADIALVQSISEIVKVERRMLQHAELQEFAQTAFPVAAVVGRMPTPEEKISSRNTDVDQIISLLKVDIFTYVQTNDLSDASISSLADDLWRVLYTDQTREKLCIGTILEINEKVNVWNPFAAFQITAIHTYVHTTGGL